MPLPSDRPLGEEDIVRTRFDTAFRGYRMAQVDQALQRAAYDIGYKGELIGVLEAEVAALREGRTADADVLRRAREAAIAAAAPGQPVACRPRSARRRDPLRSVADVPAGRRRSRPPRATAGRREGQGREPTGSRRSADERDRAGRRARRRRQPGTGEVTATVIVNAPAERVFAAFIELGAAGRVDPVDQGAGGRGRRRRGQPDRGDHRASGPAALRDEMRVVRVDAPYEVRVVHCGKVLRGPGSMRCTPMAGDRTQVVCTSGSTCPAGAAGKLAWPVLWPGSKLSLTGALKRFGRLVEQGRLP